MLAGGQSRRMGQDKAAALLRGRPLLDHMLDKLHMLAKLGALGPRSRVAGAAVPGFPAAMFVADERSGRGPMSGLDTALGHSGSPLVLVLGIDLPLLSVALLAALLERARVTGAMATVPRALGRPQPLCAVYRRQLSAPVRRLLRADTHKLLLGVELAAAEAGGSVDTFDVETLVAAGAFSQERPVMWEFLNCNTPADLAVAEHLLERE